jgi:hypothetical protein
MSATIRVPSEVPSLTQTSWPDTPSLAENTTIDPTAVRVEESI